MEPEYLNNQPTMCGNINGNHLTPKVFSKLSFDWMFFSNFKYGDVQEQFGRNKSGMEIRYVLKTKVYLDRGVQLYFSISSFLSLKFWSIGPVSSNLSSYCTLMKLRRLISQKTARQKLKVKLYSDRAKLTL